MSPPSRNQVMNMPKPRPPSPHSLRCSLSSAWRQRAAAKPTKVTIANRIMRMVSATALSLMSARLPLACVPGLRAGGPATPLRRLAEQIGGRAQDRDDRHPHELVPVEEGEPPQRRGGVVVERDPERPDQCGRQQDRYHDPGADVPACGDHDPGADVPECGGHDPGADVPAWEAVLPHHGPLPCFDDGPGRPPAPSRAQCYVCR